MNISTHSCCNNRPLAKVLALATLLLYASTPHSKTRLNNRVNSSQSFQLTSVLNFRNYQCPSLSRAKEDYQHHCHWYPRQHLHQHYNKYASIFNEQPLRPLSFHQQLAMLDLFDIQGVTAHKYDLITMVRLTQNKHLSSFSNLQKAQVREWREVEGEVVHEKACLNNNQCKEKTSEALHRMGMYDAQIPRYQHYDYTILLGGSIQEMQWRMLMLLRLFEVSTQVDEMDLGKIVALTCNRLVKESEVSATSHITMFDVTLELVKGGKTRAKALIDGDTEVLLTETTSYQAIYFALQQMSASPEYFSRFKETTHGYHPHQPISFLAKDSFEASLYKEQSFTFQLSEHFPEVLQHFLARYPEANFFETLMEKKGGLKKRPTTKQTVNKWLASLNNELDCKDPEYCKILIISTSPSTFYQHTAVVQGFEETLTRSKNLIYEISTAGPAASRDIPTNSLLDNLTKLLYLEAFHPES